MPSTTRSRQVGRLPSVARNETHESDTGEWLPRPKSVAELREAARFLAFLGERPQRTAQVMDVVFGKESARDLADSLEIGRQWAQAKHEAAPRFRDHAWEIPAAPLQMNLERGAVPGLRSVLARLGGGYRRASQTLGELVTGGLPKSSADRVELAKVRAGGRIADATRVALGEAERQGGGELLERRGFWLTREQSEHVPVRDRSTAGGGVDKAPMLPPMEIVAAAELIERESGRVAPTSWNEPGSSSNAMRSRTVRRPRQW